MGAVTSRNYIGKYTSDYITLNVPAVAFSNVPLQKWSMRLAKCDPSRKSIRFFYDLPVSAFIRSDTLEYSFYLQLGDILFHCFWSYAYPPGKFSCT